MKGALERNLNLANAIGEDTDARGDLYEAVCWCKESLFNLADFCGRAEVPVLAVVRGPRAFLEPDMDRAWNIDVYRVLEMEWLLGWPLGRPQDLGLPLDRERLRPGRRRGDATRA
ncbi:hypothetical protein HPB50_028442 [Hyalomma asiaticum]|nr:hypothetical protein HPB50_028442 [Hyalomma asiaticum]